MALTANRHSRMIVGDMVELPVKAAVHIYAGGFVCVNSDSGYAVPGVGAANSVCMGIAESEADNTNGDSGDINVRVRRVGVFLMAASSIAIASVGLVMYLQASADTFDETVGTGSVKCGVLIKVESSTSGWIEIGRRE